MRTGAPTSGERCAPSAWGAAHGPKRERFEVLYDCGEMEFVARTGKASKPHPLEAVMGFQVCEAHLDTLSFVARSGECFGRHLLPCDIAGVLVEVARDLACIG